MGCATVLTRKVAMIPNFPQSPITVDSLSSTYPTGCCGVERSLFLFRYCHGLGLGVFLSNLHHMAMQSLDGGRKHPPRSSSRCIGPCSSRRGLRAIQSGNNIPHFDEPVFVRCYSLFSHLPFPTYSRSPRKRQRVKCHVVQVLEFNRTSLLWHFHGRQDFHLTVPHVAFHRAGFLMVKGAVWTKVVCILAHGLLHQCR